MGIATDAMRRLVSPAALRDALAISTWLYDRLIEQGLPSVVISRGAHGRTCRRHDIDRVIAWLEERDAERRQQCRAAGPR